MKHVRGLVLVLVVFSMVLTACAAPAATTPSTEETTGGEERSTVSFWHIFGSGPSREALEQVVADFNESNADYQVELVFTDFWTYEQELLAAVAAGQPPDLAMTDMTRAGQRAEAEQVIPLTEYVERDQIDMTSFWEYPQKDVVYNGEIWGIPFGPDTRILFYDKDMFTEAGLDPEQPPVTWDDLWRMAHELDQKDDQGNWTRIGFNPTWGNVWYLPFIWSNGAVLVTDENEFQFNTPEVIETAQWYDQWADFYGREELDVFASGFGTGAQDPFISGQVAMIIQTQNYIRTIQTYAADKNWGAALIPYNVEPASWGAGFDLEIPKGAANPDGAWEFIKYLTSTDVAVTVASAAGWLPASVEAARDPILMETQGWDVVLESMAVTQSRKFVLEAPTWYGFLITAFQEVEDGAKTPEEALNDAQAAVEAEVANYRATRGE